MVQPLQRIEGNMNPNRLRLYENLYRTSKSHTVWVTSRRQSILIKQASCETYENLATIGKQFYGSSLLFPARVHSVLDMHLWKS